ncbi:hypothetical protein tpqmel_0577 [Candidatus Gastranaerophilus sp. (ex Termes propinquus)]|nr:hypothetical protein tpqmel_0577 [Candidatus Gastranaerophilus sp. (ex Termes propinquus)]
MTIGKIQGNIAFSGLKFDKSDSSMQALKRLQGHDGRKPVYEDVFEKLDKISADKEIVLSASYNPSIALPCMGDISLEIKDVENDTLLASARVDEFDDVFEQKHALKELPKKVERALKIKS